MLKQLEWTLDASAAWKELESKWGNKNYNCILYHEEDEIINYEQASLYAHLYRGHAAMDAASTTNATSANRCDPHFVRQRFSCSMSGII